MEIEFETISTSYSSFNKMKLCMHIPSHVKEEEWLVMCLEWGSSVDGDGVKEGG